MGLQQTWRLTCDFCYHLLPFQDQESVAVINVSEKKNWGWRSFVDGNLRKYACPVCQKTKAVKKAVEKSKL